MLASLIYILPARNAPIPIPASRAIYIVATALPRWSGWLISMINAVNAGESIPVATPYREEAHIRKKGELDCPIITREITRRINENLIIVTRPIRSDILPDTKRMIREDTVNTIKKRPLFVTPK